MKNKLPVIILSLFISCLKISFAQTSHFIGPDSLNLTKSGEVISVSLEENTGHGYYWHYVYLDSTYQESVDKISEIIVNKEGKTFRNFDFSLKKPGKVILFFELYRDWEGSTESVGQKSYPVLIQEGAQGYEEVAYRGMGARSAAQYSKIYTKLSDSEAIESYQKKTYVFTEGQSFMIDLECDVTGVSWIPEISDKEMIRLMNDQIRPLESSTLHTFKFLALSTGQCEIRFRMMLHSGDISEKPPVKYGILIEPFKPVTANHD